VHPSPTKTQDIQKQLDRKPLNANLTSPLLPLPIHSPHTRHPRLLQCRKHGITRIGAIIHIIVHRIQPGNPRTAILGRAGRTPIGAGALLRRIGDEVALAIAAVALEDVQQPEPVARLVHRRLALVVPRHGPVGHRAGLDVAPVVGVDGRRDGPPAAAADADADADARWQRALPQDAARQVRLEVDVQGRVGALAQRLFHREVVGVGGAKGPCVVDCPGQVGERESDVVGVVGSVERVHLVLRHLRRDVVFLGRRGHDVEDGRDGDGAGVAGEKRGGARGGRAVGRVAVEGLDHVQEVFGCG